MHSRLQRASYYNTHAISASVGRVIAAMSWQEPSVFETVDTVSDYKPHLCLLRGGSRGM